MTLEIGKAYTSKPDDEFPPIRRVVGRIEFDGKRYLVVDRLRRHHDEDGEWGKLTGDKRRSFISEKAMTKWAKAAAPPDGAGGTTDA